VSHDSALLHVIANNSSERAPSLPKHDTVVDIATIQRLCRRANREESRKVAEGLRRIIVIPSLRGAHWSIGQIDIHSHFQSKFWSKSEITKRRVRGGSSKDERIPKLLKDYSWRVEFHARMAQFDHARRVNLMNRVVRDILAVEA
jgi:hypothetical protein